MAIMTLEEEPVAPASVHDIGMQFTTQLGPRLRQNPPQPRDAAKAGVLAFREIRRPQFAVGCLPFLNHMEVIPPHRRHEQSRGRSRVSATVSVVFNEIIEFPGLAANRRQPRGFLRRKIVSPLTIALQVPLEAAVEQGEESEVPGGVCTHAASCSRVPASRKLHCRAGYAGIAPHARMLTGCVHGV